MAKGSGMQEQYLNMQVMQVRAGKLRTPPTKRNLCNLPFMAAWVMLDFENDSDMKYAEGNVDTKDWVDPPRKPLAVFAGIANVAGESTQGNMTVADYGTVNVRLTGIDEAIHKGDHTYVVGCRPNLSNPEDTCGHVAPSEQDEPNISREFIVGSVFRGNPTGLMLMIDANGQPAPIEEQQVWLSGKAILDARRGGISTIHLPPPRSHNLFRLGQDHGLPRGPGNIPLRVR